MEDKENSLPEEGTLEGKARIKIKKIKDSESLEKIRNPLRKLVGGIHHYLNKDLEISRGQFITLYLIFLCAASIIASNLFLSFERGAFSSNILLFLEIGISVEVGLIIGGYIVDRIRGNRYYTLFIILTISIVITFFHVFIFRRTGVITDIFFIVNSFISGILSVSPA